MQRTHNEGAFLSPLPPDDDETREKKSVYMLRSIWTQLDAIVEQENEARKKADKSPLSANRLVEHFLQWAIDDYRREKKIQEEREKSKRGK